MLFRSPRDFPPEQDDLLNQAVEYRIRSLRLVEELLRQDPSNYDLQFSRLTGEHWLAGLWGQLSDDRFESMGRKALNHADELLRKRPGSLDLLEIKLGIQYNFANNLRASNPDQSQQQLERINQTVSAHLRDFTETWSVHLYGLQALVERAEILLSLHRFEESELVLEQFSQSFNRAKKLFPNEWPVHNLYRLNLQIRCALDIAMKRYDSAFEVVQELEQFIGKEGLDLENLKTHPLSIDEGDLLKLVFFRWIISNQLFQKESHERQRSEQELSELLGSCITKPSVFDRVSKELKKLDLEVEFLNRASKHSPDGVE